MLLLKNHRSGIDQAPMFTFMGLDQSRFSEYTMTAIDDNQLKPTAFNEKAVCFETLISPEPKTNLQTQTR